jgi:hypothetical protein
MSNLASPGILAAFSMWQWMSVVGLIALVIFYMQYKKRNG